MLAEIEALAESIDSRDLHGLGTLGEYTTVFDKALQVKKYLESLTLAPLPGLSELTDDIDAVTSALESLNVDVGIDVDIDDLAILEQIHRFMVALRSMNEAVVKIKTKVHVHGELRVPDTLQRIRVVVAELGPTIETFTKTVSQLKNKTPNSDEVDTAVRELQEIVTFSEVLLNLDLDIDTSSCSVPPDATTGWKLAFIVTISILVAIFAFLMFLLLLRRVRKKG